jgi:hypothetical protein
MKFSLCVLFCSVCDHNQVRHFQSYPTHTVSVASLSWNWSIILILSSHNWTFSQYWHCVPFCDKWSSHSHQSVICVCIQWNVHAINIAITKFVYVWMNARPKVVAWAWTLSCTSKEIMSSVLVSSSSHTLPQNL